MKIDILTLFPEMFDGFINSSIIKRAIDDNHVEINAINIRDFSNNKHKKVDDYPFGGGNGMVMMLQPIVDAINSVKIESSKIFLLTPQGKVFNQKEAYRMAKSEHIILICGHYEGIDERIKFYIDGEISIGDYVLTGGEIPAMIIADSITRLLDGVIEEESHLNDSFNNNLLDFPVYTRPAMYDGKEVPEVLLSGHHAKIAEWRKKEQIKRTQQRRPDLFEAGENDEV